MRTLDIVLACVGVAVMLLFPIRVAAKYVKMGSRHKNSEARATLKALFTTQRAFLQEQDRYGRRLHELGFEPERGNRYAYFLLPSGPFQLRDAAEEKKSDEAVIVWSDRFKHTTATPMPTDVAGTGCPVTPGMDAAGKPVGVGVWGTPPKEVFVALAAGNLDDDPVLDCWSIASMPRVDASGEPIPAGEPYHEQDDVPPTTWQRIRATLVGPL